MLLGSVIVAPIHGRQRIRELCVKQLDLWTSTLLLCMFLDFSKSQNGYDDYSSSDNNKNTSTTGGVRLVCVQIGDPKKCGVLPCFQKKAIDLGHFLKMHPKTKTNQK